MEREKTLLIISQRDFFLESEEGIVSAVCKPDCRVASFADDVNR